MSVIEVKNLTVAREKTQIFRDLSFSLEEGSFTVLSGPSGCGKTTILLALQGLLGDEDEAVTLSGEILVDGEKVENVKHSEGVAARSGFLMQNVDAQIVNLLCEDELAFGMENRGLSPEEMRRRISEYAPLFGVELDKTVLSCSGGQKQRLLIASCLCTGHRVLLLDEPFANLDLPGAEILRYTLSSLCSQGVTVLCVEHRLEMIKDLADEILWLESGELTRHRGHDAVKAFAEKKAEILFPAPTWNTGIGKEILNAKKLSARRGEKQVLQDLSIKLHAGETGLLLGPNGCGKTTLMRALCGLARYSELRADSLNYLGEERLRRFRYRKLRKQVGMVLQNPVHQLFMKSVREELLLRDPDEAAVNEILETFRIAHLRDRHPYSLSMGEKRRVTVAAVAAAGSPLLLLDEPTIGQDYENLKSMAASLRALQARTGVAILLSTHDENAVKLFGGKTIAMGKGT